MSRGSLNNHLPTVSGMSAPWRNSATLARTNVIMFTSGALEYVYESGILGLQCSRKALLCSAK